MSIGTTRERETSCSQEVLTPRQGPRKSRDLTKGPGRAVPTFLPYSKHLNLSPILILRPTFITTTKYPTPMPNSLLPTSLLSILFPPRPPSWPLTSWHTHARVKTLRLLVETVLFHKALVNASYVCSSAWINLWVLFSLANSNETQVSTFILKLTLFLRANQMHILSQWLLKGK